jgi:malonate transporter and related proteins
MSILIDVILPVFLVIALGYAAARAKLIDDNGIDGIMRFAQNFALPILLFKSIAALDLSNSFQPGLLISFYAGAFSGFAFGFSLSRFVFHRSLAECVALGFACLFSNSLLLGVPITERAYGPDALAGNFAIISIHAPILYSFGIMLMEWVRARDTVARSQPVAVMILRRVFSQPLVIGIVCGFTVNLSGLPLPVAVAAAVEMMARAGLPAALFGLGGVLLRYHPEGDKALIAVVCFASLVLHPTVTYLLSRFAFELDTASLRSATLTAAMAPGVNAYMFAHLYGVGRRVAATSVLMGTVLCIPSVWLWLHILP